LVWSFVFIFSPTVSVLLVGQSSLFVLFTALLTMVLYQLDKSRSAGLSLALALTKPHLAFPVACLLLFRRQYTTTITAIAAFGLLAVGGFYIGHSDVHTYMQGLSRYASWNSGANPRHVGLQNLFTGVLGLAASAGSVLSVSCGLVFLGITLALDSKVHCRARTEDVLPVVLLVSVLAFGAHSYDLVLLIPVFVWAMGRRREDKRYLPMVILCFLLIVPLGAVTIAYEAVLSKLVPLAVFKVVIEPFRSWILLVMFVLSVYLTYRRVGQPRQGGRATT
jgi:hypothetical protein